MEEKKNISAAARRLIAGVRYGGPEYKAAVRALKNTIILHGRSTNRETAAKYAGNAIWKAWNEVGKREYSPEYLKMRGWEK